MDKILNFIKKSNQVLFFLAAIFIIGAIATKFISDLLSGYEPPKIELVDTSDPKSEIKKQVYTIDFMRKLQDVFIFQLTSDVIDISQNHEDAEIGYFAPSTLSHRFSGTYLNDNAVNFMFVKENGSQTMLLAKDGLITEFTMAVFDPDKHSYRLDKNLYLIIDKDTNNNGFLDQEDSTQLYSSTYDGKELTLILSNVGSFQQIGDNALIISQKGKEESYHTYNVTTSSLIKLNTAINVSSQ